MKKEIRKVFFKRRDGLTPTKHAEIEQKMIAQFLKAINLLLSKDCQPPLLPNTQREVVVGSFYSVRSEIKAQSILDQLMEQGTHFNGKKLICSLPAVESMKESTMKFRRYEGVDGLVRSKLGIMEPKPENDALEPDILVAPLCCYDLSLNRIGFGSGFFDKYIEELRSK